MKPEIRKLKISALRAQMEASRLLCESLTSSFDTATTEEQKATIVNQWDRAMKECNTLELALAILEKQAREAGADPGTGI